MFSELIPLSFEKIMQMRSYTVIVLNGQGKHFAIYMEPTVGRYLQLFLTGTEKARPLTHNLLSCILKGYEMKIRQLVITDLQDTVYFARLFLQQNVGNIHHIVEVDSRPSDGIILALINNAPVFCTREVLEKTVILEEEWE